MGKKPRDPFDIPDIPDIPGLDDDEPSGGAGAGRSAKGAAKRGASGSTASGGASAGPRPAKSGKSRRGLFFLAGLVLGVAAALLLPPLARDYLGPDLPGFLGGGGEVVSGPVLGKRAEEGRLLLTVDAAQGAMLATFTERTSEIDLLVSEGDTIELGVDAYEPFVNDPEFRGIRKSRAAAEQAGAREAQPGRGAAAPDTTGAAPPAGADTAAAAGDTTADGTGPGSSDTASRDGPSA